MIIHRSLKALFPHQQVSRNGQLLWPLNHASPHARRGELYRAYRPTTARFRSEGQVAQHAKAAWEQGTIDLALDILNQGLQDHPHALTLHQLRGDMLATSRHTEAALNPYDTVPAQLPAALNVRWAKWSVLVRSGQVEEAVIELQRIAGIDPRNPLIFTAGAGTPQVGPTGRRLRGLQERRGARTGHAQLALGLARARGSTFWITKERSVTCNSS